TVSNKALLNLCADSGFKNCAFWISCIKANAIGNIIKAVAAFEIHIDINAVAIMVPKIILLLLEPIIAIIVIAIRLCKFHFSIAKAIMKPPIYIKTIGSA